MATALNASVHHLSSPEEQAERTRIIQSIQQILVNLQYSGMALPQQTHVQITPMAKNHSLSIESKLLSSRLCIEYKFVSGSDMAFHFSGSGEAFGAPAAFRFEDPGEASAELLAKVLIFVQRYVSLLEQPLEGREWVRCHDALWQVMDQTPVGEQDIGGVRVVVINEDDASEHNTLLKSIKIISEDAPKKPLVLLLRKSRIRRQGDMRINNLIIFKELPDGRSETLLDVFGNNLTATQYQQIMQQLLEYQRVAMSADVQSQVEGVL